MPIVMQNPVKAEGSLWTRGYPSCSLGLTDENGVSKQRDHVGRSKKSTKHSYLALMLIRNNELSTAGYCIHFTLIIHCGDGEVAFVLDTVTAAGKSQDQVFLGQITVFCACVGT